MGTDAFLPRKRAPSSPEMPEAVCNANAPRNRCHSLSFAFGQHLTGAFVLPLWVLGFLRSSVQPPATVKRNGARLPLVVREVSAA